MTNVIIGIRQYRISYSAINKKYFKRDFNNCLHSINREKSCRFCTCEKYIIIISESIDFRSFDLKSIILILILNSIKINLFSFREKPRFLPKVPCKKLILCEIFCLEGIS